MLIAQWHFSFHSPLSIPVNFTLSLSLCYLPKKVNYGIKEKKFFLHIWLFQRISLYQRRQKIISLGTIKFLDAHVCINNSDWQSSGIIIFMWKYDIVISDTLVDSLLDVFFLLLAVILLELHEKPRRKDWVTEKST